MAADLDRYITRPDDAPTVRQLARRKVRARREYECAFCLKPIAAGQTHIVDVAVIDGQFSAIRHHDHDGE